MFPSNAPFSFLLKLESRILIYKHRYNINLIKLWRTLTHVTKVIVCSYFSLDCLFFFSCFIINPTSSYILFNSLPGLIFLDLPTMKTVEKMQHLNKWNTCIHYYHIDVGGKNGEKEEIASLEVTFRLHNIYSLVRVFKMQIININQMLLWPSFVKGKILMQVHVSGRCTGMSLCSYYFDTCRHILRICNWKQDSVCDWCPRMATSRSKVKVKNFGTDRKVMSQGIHMWNMVAVPVMVQK